MEEKQWSRKKSKQTNEKVLSRPSCPRLSMPFGSWWRGCTKVEAPIKLDADIFLAFPNHLMADSDWMSRVDTSL